MGRFNVGDLVKCIDCNGSAKGVFNETDIYEIESLGDNDGFVLIRGIQAELQYGFRWLWTEKRFVRAPALSFSKYLDAVTGGKDV